MAVANVVTNGFGLGGAGAVPFYLTLGYGDYSGAPAEEEEEESSAGGGVIVRTKRRERRPARDIPHPGQHSRTTFAPIIRDTATDQPKAPDLPALLAAWMAFEDL